MKYNTGITRQQQTELNNNSSNIPEAKANKKDCPWRREEQTLLRYNIAVVEDAQVSSKQRDI